MKIIIMNIVILLFGGQINLLAQQIVDIKYLEDETFSSKINIENQASTIFRINAIGTYIVRFEFVLEEGFISDSPLLMNDSENHPQSILLSKKVRGTKTIFVYIINEPGTYSLEIDHNKYNNNYLQVQVDADFYGEKSNVQSEVLYSLSNDDHFFYYRELDPTDIHNEDIVFGENMYINAVEISQRSEITMSATLNTEVGGQYSSPRFSIMRPEESFSDIASDIKTTITSSNTGEHYKIKKILEPGKYLLINQINSEDVPLELYNRVVPIPKSKVDIGIKEFYEQQLDLYLGVSHLNPPHELNVSSELMNSSILFYEIILGEGKKIESLSPKVHIRNLEGNLISSPLQITKLHDRYIIKTPILPKGKYELSVDLSVNSPSDYTFIVKYRKAEDYETWGDSNFYIRNDIFDYKKQFGLSNIQAVNIYIDVDSYSSINNTIKFNKPILGLLKYTLIDFIANDWISLEVKKIDSYTISLKSEILQPSTYKLELKLNSPEVDVVDYSFYRDSDPELSILDAPISLESLSKNFIISRSYYSKGEEQPIDNIQYFDGVGRKSLSIQKKANPTRHDIASYTRYDALGREYQSWLPTPIEGNNNGAFISIGTINSLSQENLYYEYDTKPYSQPIYESSPLNRVVEQYGPGADWHTKGKSIKTFYLTNKGWANTQSSSVMDDTNTLSGVYTSCNLITLKPGFQFKATEEKSLHLYTDPNLCQAPKFMNRTVSATPILRDEFLMCSNYKVNNNELTKDNNYKANELSVTLIIDEDDNKSLEFEDKLGQIVLTRQINGTEKYDTYYIYDDFGNLSYVLPPKAVDEVSNYADTDVKMKQYAYIYKYDSRNRCVWKKLPGADPILYVYDKADQLIFTQDGEQRKNSEWLFTLSDIFGRSVLNGTIKGNTSIKSGMWDDIMAAPVVRANYTGSTSNLGYQITGFVFTPTTLISANFYDNYSFLGKNAIPNNVDTQYNIETGYDVCYGNHTDLLKSKGLLTGTLTAQLPSGTMLYSIMYYDDKGRVIQTKSNNHLSGGVEKEYIAYNFTGQPTKKMHIHQAKDKPTQMEFYAYEYDHAGRLLKIKHKLDELPETILAENSYDELGRLKTNTKGNKFATTYDYNIRSWTKSIETKNGATLLFSQKLYYNDKVIAHNYPDYQPSYSGNVSGMEWQLQGEVKRSNRFHYDELSRLKNSAYNGVTALKGAYNTDYTYDKHGNIISFVQYGSNANTPIDNLQMRYVGNQLNNIHNEGTGLISGSSAHFQDYSIDKTLAKQEYTYNANGAMTSDLNKGVSSITYNSLNLPTKLTIDNISKGGKAKGTIEYMYSASGVKLRTVHTDNATIAKNAPILTAGVFATTTDVKTTDYVGNKIYENGKLKQTLIDGGYIKDGKYYYYLTDHLGNNRAVAEATTGTLLQKTHYYPFGMAFAETTGEQEQPFKYNGKELDREMQLNIYDYAARYMDPAIGRFTSIDPLAEKYYSISPYVYVANNPLKYIDPDGRKIVTYNYSRMNARGGLTGQKGLSTTTSSAISTYMKTEEGYNTIARYASKGDEIGGHTFIVDGELSGHTLEIRDISLSEEKGQIVPEGTNGTISLDTKSDGKSTLRIQSLGRSAADIVETLAHELNVHGSSHKDQLAGKKAPSTDQDHKALRDKDTKHQGYSKYNKVRQELKKQGNQYEKVFQSKEEEYKGKYKEL